VSGTTKAAYGSDFPGLSPLRAAFPHYGGFGGHYLKIEGGSFDSGSTPRSTQLWNLLLKSTPIYVANWWSSIDPMFWSSRDSS
jgi:hypothetical protein